MYRQGDIVLVNSYNSHSVKISRHSFIVLEDGGGVLEDNGRRLYFDFIAVVMSSAKSPEQLRYKLLKYPGNFPLGAYERIITLKSGRNNKSGYVKCDQFYFFQYNRINMQKIGYVMSSAFEAIKEYINELGSSIDTSSGRMFELEYIIDNLS